MYVITMITNNFFTTKNSSVVLQLLLKNNILQRANRFQCLAM